jgi:FkbM family methyltransferase
MSDSSETGKVTGLEPVARIFRIAPPLLTTWGWWGLVADLLHWKKKPYRFGQRMMRPRTTDAGIYAEVFGGQSYRPTLPFVRQAKCIVDVGANVGFFSEWCRRNNPEARIHLFEPLTGNAQRCVLDSKMFLHQAAVADYSGKLPVTAEPDVNYGSGHLTKGHFASTDPHPPIDVLDARDLFKICNTELIDVLKLDCEGAELGILRCLDLSRVRCVIFEFHNLEELPQIRDTLTQKQFEIRSTDNYHRVMYAVNRVQPPQPAAG